MLSLGFLAKKSQPFQQLAAGSPSPRLSAWAKDRFHIRTKWHFPELRILPEVYFYLPGAVAQVGSSRSCFTGAITAR